MKNDSKLNCSVKRVFLCVFTADVDTVEQPDDTALAGECI